MAQQTNENSERYSCDFCTDTFAFRSGLSRHVAKKHKSETEDQETNTYCELCTEMPR